MTEKRSERGGARGERESQREKKKQQEQKRKEKNYPTHRASSTAATSPKAASARRAIALGDVGTGAGGLPGASAVPRVWSAGGALPFLLPLKAVAVPPPPLLPSGTARTRSRAIRGAQERILESAMEAVAALEGGIEFWKASEASDEGEMVSLSPPPPPPTTPAQEGDGAAAPSMIARFPAASAAAAASSSGPEAKEETSASRTIEAERGGEEGAV